MDVARDLYEVLRQFFTMFEDYRGNPFFVTGESYAGKYVPAIGYKIHSMGVEAKKAGINMQGLAIGNGICDPRSQLNYADFLYQAGMLDEAQRDHFRLKQTEMIKLIDGKDFAGAVRILEDLFMSIPGREGFSTYLSNATGLQAYHDFVNSSKWLNLLFYLAEFVIPSLRTRGIFT